MEARGCERDRRRGERRGPCDRLGGMALEGHAKRTDATLCARYGAWGCGPFYDVLILLRSVNGQQSLVNGNNEHLFSCQCQLPIDQ